MIVHMIMKKINNKILKLKKSKSTNEKNKTTKNLL